jgi:hypothetical protein
MPPNLCFRDRETTDFNYFRVLPLISCLIPANRNFEDEKKHKRPNRILAAFFGKW